MAWFVIESMCRCIPHEDVLNWESKGTTLIFDLKVHIKFIGYDVTIKYRLHLELTSQKMGQEMQGFELGAFQFQTQRSSTELTCRLTKFNLSKVTLSSLFHIPHNILMQHRKL